MAGTEKINFATCTIIHILEDGEVDIMSSSTADIIVVDDRKSEEFKYVVNDDPEMLREFMDLSGSESIEVRVADNEYESDAPIVSYLRPVK